MFCKQNINFMSFVYMYTYSYYPHFCQTKQVLYKYLEYENAHIIVNNK